MKEKYCTCYAQPSTCLQPLNAGFLFAFFHTYLLHPPSLFLPSLFFSIACGRRVTHVCVRVAGGGLIAFSHAMPPPAPAHLRAHPFLSLLKKAALPFS